MVEFSKMKEAVLIDANEPLSKAISELGRVKTCVVVLKDKEYAGLIDDRSIRQLSQPQHSAKVETVAERAPVISSASSLADVCRLFFTGRFKALPLMDKKKVLGIVTRADVLELLLDSNAIPKKRVSELMSSPVAEILETASIAQARSKMHDHNVRRLVVTNELGKLAGVISTYDLAIGLSSPKEKLPLAREKSGISSQPVRSFMRSDIETILQTAPISKAARVMAENDISSLVVVGSEDEVNMPLGLLSARDIFESVLVSDKPAIFISGLAPEDKEYTPDIENLAARMMEKLKKSFTVQYLSLHVKKYKHKYSIRARLMSDKLVSARAFGWELEGVIWQTLKDIQKLMQKEKPNKMHKKR
ncbi:MAG: CBS domain-containing protein [Candidatus Micrarchaeota archaeon]